jgi:hypothetical protein
LASTAPIFASQRPHEEDAWLAAPLFPDPSQGLQEDSAPPNRSTGTNDDPILDSSQPDSDLLSDQIAHGLS